MGKIILGDCLEVMRDIDPSKIALVLTDPPYPDYHVELYGYKDGLLDELNRFTCRQFVFWSARVDFPLSYTAIHIWDKKVGISTSYERIFERNGNKDYRVYRHYFINSSVAAKMAGDEYTGHKSQKPTKLLKEIIARYTKEGDTVLDPFAGSGSTLVAAKQLNRNYIGIEINPDYVKIAEDRLKQGVLL